MAGRPPIAGVPSLSSDEGRPKFTSFELEVDEFENVIAASSGLLPYWSDVSSTSFSSKGIRAAFTTSSRGSGESLAVSKSSKSRRSEDSPIWKYLVFKVLGDALIVVLDETFQVVLGEDLPYELLDLEELMDLMSSLA